MTPSFCVIPTS